MKTVIYIFLLCSAFVTGYLTGFTHAKYVEIYIRKSPCTQTGYTKIEYGLGVTNCGDTVRVAEFADQVLYSVK